MKKQIPLSKYSKKIQDGIIKLVPRATAVVEEQENMSSKPPKWFEEWNKQVYEKRRPAWFEEWNKEFSKEFSEFKHEVLTRLDRIESTPTMKKELEGLKK